MTAGYPEEVPTPCDGFTASLVQWLNTMTTTRATTEQRPTRLPANTLAPDQRRSDDRTQTRNRSGLRLQPLLGI